jgi:uncharacterized OB-fold protein
MAIPAHPGLYDPEDTVPLLHGTRCTACASVFFPPLGIGCEACGADAGALVPTTLDARGVLHAVATVHARARTPGAVPYTVAEVLLDAGPLVRALMDEDAGVDAIGKRVEARWAVARTDADGNDVVEPRFALAAAPAANPT